MSGLLLKRLLLLSRSEKKARAIRFNPRVTVLTGENDTGKSSIVKSILHCLGAEPPLHPKWKAARVATLLQVQIAGRDYAFLRDGPQITVFEGLGSSNGISFDSVTNGLGPYLARLCYFGLKLIDRNDKSVTPPPAFLLLPYYFDQDRSWTSSWNSFDRLGQMKRWKQDVVEYHTGIRGNAFYEAKTQHSILLQKRAVMEAGIESLRKLRSDLVEQLQAVPFNVDLDAFRQEITDLLVECQKIQQTAEKVRERLVHLHNERILIESQIEIVKGSLKELSADYEFLRTRDDHIDCPTCGAHYSNNFHDVFQIALDEDRCEDLLGRLKDDLSDLKRKIEADSVAHSTHESEAARIRTLLSQRKEEVSLSDLIASQSRNQVSEVLKDRMRGAAQEMSELEAGLSSLKRDMERLTSKEVRDRINSDFRDFMSRYLFRLSVHGISEELYSTVTSTIREQGSDLPRALLAYAFSILQVMRNNTTSVFCPIILDSPIQQEQDSDNHRRIIEFIRDNQPEGSQMILSVVDTKGTVFGGDEIRFDRPLSVLLEEDYEAIGAEMGPYLNTAFRLSEGDTLF